MECSECGRTVASDHNFCPYCGCQFSEPPFRPSGHALGPQPSKAKGASERSTLVLVITIVVVVVVLPVVLSAIMYFMVLGFGGTDSGSPKAALAAVPTSLGYKCLLSSMTRSVDWSDLFILLDGVMLTPDGSSLESGSTSVNHLPSIYLGQTLVWCNVTDVQGNGAANDGDYFTFETGSSMSFTGTGPHTVKMIHTPTSSDICWTVFNV